MKAKQKPSTPAPASPIQAMAARMAHLHERHDRLQVLGSAAFHGRLHWRGTDKTDWDRWGQHCYEEIRALRHAILISEPLNLADVAVMLAAAREHSGVLDDAVKTAQQELDPVDRRPVLVDVADELVWAKEHSAALWCALNAIVGRMIRHTRGDIPRGFVEAFCDVQPGSQQGHGPPLDELPSVPAA